MGQKVNPISNRLGYIHPWESNWIASKKEFAGKLKEDHIIRSFIKKNLPADIISRVIIERTLKLVTLIIHTSRPGIIIGPGGEKIQGLSQKIKDKLKKNVQINIQEVKRPELDARLVAEHLALEVKKRANYKGPINKAIDSAMRIGAKGVQISIAGRLKGNDIARTEVFKNGRMPLHTLRAEIDYAGTTSFTIYGAIGIKVWIFKKEVYGKRDLTLRVKNVKEPRKSTNPFGRFSKNKP